MAAKKKPKQETTPPSDTVKGVPRYLSIAELEEILGVSRDTICRRAGQSLPPLHEITPGRRVALITDVRALQEGRRPWLKAG